VSVDEAALVRRCLRGDAEAVRALVERFQAEVYGLCVRLLNHRHDAEDVTQEVFLRVFRSLRRWDASRPLKPWIMGITVNRCRTWLAQRSRRPELVDYLQDTAAGPPEDDTAELVREIQSAVAALRPDYRTVFVLFHEQGQPYEEIAAAMERPVGTIKTWLHRARLEVLERLRQRGMVPPDTSPESLSSPGTAPGRRLER
jgi:RNA polymerase sigma factor (sigma-70 family)